MFDSINYFKKRLLIKNAFEVEPIDFDTLIYSKNYLGLPQLSKQQYDFMFHMSNVYDNCQYTRGVLEWGKGSGKDWISANLGLAIVYNISCLDDPYSYYNLATDSHIDLLNVAYSAAQANNIYFEYLKQKVENTPMFEEFGKPKIGKNVIRFPKRINFYSGHSDQESWEGLNLIFGFADEIAAFDIDEKKQKKKRVASNMWEMIDDSIYSRFPQHGKGIAASFPRYKDDYIEHLYSLAKDIDKRCKEENKLNYFYYSYGATWDINPTKTKEMFARKYEINPEDAKCKFECIPPMAVDAFYKDPQRIDNCKIYKHHPVDSLGRWKHNFVGNQEYIYYCRFDLSKNHDATGFAMVHVSNYDSKDKPIVDVDVIRRYIPKRGQDLDYSSMRQDILSLQRKGFDLRCSFDQYQSLDFAQILEKEGIRTSRFSVDRTIEQHTTLKNLIYDKRIRLYIDKKLQQELRGKDDPSFLLHELKTLRLIEGRKVDHPPTGSKDIADALAGAVYDALQCPEGFTEVFGF